MPNNNIKTKVIQKAKKKNNTSCDFQSNMCGNEIQTRLPRSEPAQRYGIISIKTKKKGSQEINTYQLIAEAPLCLGNIEG